LIENEQEWQYLKRWATREFLSLPQLTKVIVTQTIAENKEASQEKSP
jgi:hypothetical protein